MVVQKVSCLSFSGKVGVGIANSVKTTPKTRPMESDTFVKTATNPIQPLKKNLNPYTEAVQVMTAAKFDRESINLAVREKVDVNKVVAIAKGMSTDNTEKLILRNCPYDKENTYAVKAFNKDKSTTLKLIDKKYNILTQESSTYVPNKAGKAQPDRLVKTQDFRNNTFSETLFEKRNGFEVAVKEINTKRDRQGEVLRKEVITESEIPGMYNVKYKFPNGKSRDVSLVNVDKKTGNVCITKDMRSADMTKTTYRYEDDPEGNRLMEYKVVDTKGNVLMNQSSTFEKISENKFRSTRNDRAFLVELNENSLDVIDEKKREITQIPLTNFVQGDKKKIVNMLKTMPGDELLNMAGSVINVKEIPDRLDSYCQTQLYRGPNGQVITAGTLAVSDDPFVFLHELGHATDMCGKEAQIKFDPFTGQANSVDIKGAIHKDKKFLETYAEERKNFLKEFPDQKRSYIDYFIASEAVKGQEDRGRQETIAETNAILNTYQTVDLLGMRTLYLQQHFPKTIAHLSTILTQDK